MSHHVHDVRPVRPHRLPSFHCPREPRFLMRFGSYVLLTWGFATLSTWVLIRHGAPVWFIAVFPGPLWAVLGAVFVEDHYKGGVV